MAAKPREVTVRHHGATAVLDLVGEIDTYGEEAFLQGETSHAAG